MIAAIYARKSTDQNVPDEEGRMMARKRGSPSATKAPATTDEKVLAKLDAIEDRLSAIEDELSSLTTIAGDISSSEQHLRFIEKWLRPRGGS
jgi:hypothetical protein